jgi:hypothetical protein
MDDFQLALAYGAFMVAVTCVTLLLLSWRLDRKRYLRPVIYGFIFGAGCSVLFGANPVSPLFGGILTGYLLAREEGNWLLQFRAGAMNAVLIDLIIFLRAVLILLTRGSVEALGQAAGSEGLFWLYGSTIFVLFGDITVIGGGAVVGGLLRKVFSPKTPPAPPAQAPSVQT